MSSLTRVKSTYLFEDNFELGNLLVNFLSEQGIQVIWFQNPNDFDFSFDGVDLVITDCNMPGMNGLDLTSKIREKHSSVPIFMWSGEVGVDRDFITRGGSQFFNKTDVLGMIEVISAPND